MKRGAWLAAVLVLAAVSGNACSKKAAVDSSAPGDAAAPESPAGAESKSLDFYQEELVDDIDAIEDRLSRVEDELAGVGLGGETEGGTPTAADEDADRCERVCNLAESICDLEGKICDLAEKHEGEERYAKACTRAEEHCERATKACTACAG